MSALALAVSAAAASCDGQGPESTVVVAVVVTPSSPTLIGLGVTLQFVAEARNDRGHAIADVPVAWASLDTSIVRISASGLVTAVLAGTATITATAGEVVGEASVRVRMTSGPSNWLAVVSGSGQAATQHYRLHDSLVVLASDESGYTIPGVPVTFAVPAGGGQMTCHKCFDCLGVARAQDTTESNGTAIMGLFPGPLSGCTEPPPVW